jgi:hypothetical protein
MSDESNMEAMAPIDFPFERNREYLFGDLRECQSKLSRIRQKRFSDDLRRNKLPWAKHYNEELAPIALLADHKGFDDREKFTLTPEGHPVDVVLRLHDKMIPCQVTVAFPAWPEMSIKGGGGHEYSLRMELLGKGKPYFGGGKTRRGGKTRKDHGVIISEPHARHPLVDYAACKAGLVAAIKRKQSYDGAGRALLIYAREYHIHLIDLDAHVLIEDAVREAGGITFHPLWVVDQGLFWEAP